MNKFLLGMVLVSFFLITPIASSDVCEPGDRKCVNGYILECVYDPIYETWTWKKTFESCFGPNCDNYSYTEKTSELYSLLDNR